jgi:hypothetical protein
VAHQDHQLLAVPPIGVDRSTPGISALALLNTGQEDELRTDGPGSADVSTQKIIRTDPAVPLAHVGQRVSVAAFHFSGKRCAGIVDVQAGTYRPMVLISSYCSGNRPMVNGFQVGVVSDGDGL